MNKIALAERLSQYFASTEHDSNTLFDYCYQHPHAAMETVAHHGTLSDMNYMLIAEKVLNIPVSWDLYTFINSQIDDDLLAECKRNPDGIGALFTRLAFAYTFDYSGNKS